jgi:hypothetical protein
MNQITQEKLTLQTTVKTDGWKSFKKIKQVVDKHICKVVPLSESSKVLPWLHTMIYNTKRNLLGIHYYYYYYGDNFIDLLGALIKLKIINNLKTLSYNFGHMKNNKELNILSRHRIDNFRD